MKQTTPIQGALIGFSGGLAILVTTLALEVYARELPFRGGLLQLQLESVAVWVLESMPVLLAGAAYVVMTPPEPRQVEIAVGRTRAAVSSGAFDVKKSQSTPEPSLPTTVPRPGLLSGPSGVPQLPGPVDAPTSSGPRALSSPNAEPVSDVLPTASGPRAAPPIEGVPHAVTPSGAGGAGVASPLPPPPPVPAALRQANLLGQAHADHRVRALEELVKRLKETAAHASEESQAKSLLLTNLTEELRAPLSEIVGVTEMLVDEARSPASGRASLEPDLRRVAGAGRYLVRLINEILDLSRIEVGQIRLVLEDVDLAQVVEEVRATVGSVPGLSIHLDPAARMVRGDHMRIRQILSTLVHDAVGVSSGGPVTVTIERTAKGRIELRVRDSGPQLSEPQIERLLDRAPLSDQARHPDERRGLGLAVARRLAELMNGGLTGRSEPHRKGCEFLLSLPVARIPADQVRPRSTIALNERLSGMKLVLLDGDPSSRPLASYLGRAGLQIAHVSTVLDARDAAANRPELAVVDVGLSGAWDLVERFLEQGIRVIATSLRDEDVEPALQRGVTAFLVRPVDRKLALATLERCLDG